MSLVLRKMWRWWGTTTLGCGLETFELHFGVLDDTLERIRAVLVQTVEKTTDGERDTLWALIAVGAAQAREDGVPVERFIVRMKEAWDGTLHERGGTADLRMQRLKQDIVTRAIKAYYMQ